MEEAWKIFETTGSITDYLKFKGIETDYMPEQKSFRMALGKEQDGTEYRSDRNGLTGNADWRL